MSADPIDNGRHHAFPGLPRAEAAAAAARASAVAAGHAATTALSTVRAVQASIDDQLDALLEARDPYDMDPTIAAIGAVVAKHPRHARALYELGNAHAMNRDEARARRLYEDALSAGLSGELLRRCLLRYGAVLHSLGETEQATRLINEARSRFAGPPSSQIFDAIQLHMSGRTDEAFAALLEIVTESFGVSEEDRFRAAYFRALLPTDGP